MNDENVMYSCDVSKSLMAKLFAMIFKSRSGTRGAIDGDDEETAREKRDDIRARTARVVNTYEIARDALLKRK